MFSICQNPEEVGSNAGEEMDLLARVRTNKQKERFQVLYRGRQKARPRLKVSLLPAIEGVWTS